WQIEHLVAGSRSELVSADVEELASSVADGDGVPRAVPAELPVDDGLTFESALLLKRLERILVGHERLSPALDGICARKRSAAPRVTETLLHGCGIRGVGVHPLQGCGSDVEADLALQILHKVVDRSAVITLEAVPLALVGIHACRGRLARARVFAHRTEHPLLALWRL